MTRSEKYLVWIASAGVTLTGVVYAWMKYVMRPADPFAVVNSPLQPLVLKLHIVSAPILVFAIGMIFTRHAWRNYRERVQSGRRSGLSALVVVLPMIATGYLVEVLADASWVRVLGYVHFALGSAFAVATLVHAVVIGQREP